MRWEEEGILLDVRKYGETSAIIDVFTPTLGRRVGMLKGAFNKRNKSVIQPGNQLFLKWSSRIEEGLGDFKVELVKSRYHTISGQKIKLELFNSICFMCRAFLPERLEFQELYHQTRSYIEAELTVQENLKKYIEWELILLSSLGFGLDLSKCVVSGSRDDLKFVSPKSGCAVSRKSGLGWEKKLLILPDFLRYKQSVKDLSKADLKSGFKLTEYFIKKHLHPVRRFKLESFFDSRKRVLGLTSF